jgi:hypothetical protein
VLPLILAAIVFAFLLLGSVVFVVCALIPPLRRYSLSAALWCAMWGPCSVAFLLLAGLGFEAHAFATKSGGLLSIHALGLLDTFGWAYLVFWILTTTGVATVVAWFHQALVRRQTFALFRLYATAITAGIGSVFGWFFGWWLSASDVTRHVLPWWLLGMVSLIAAFGYAAYQGARQLRGEPPTSFTWISPEEFAGTDQT